uniref:DUF5678 domain-containing protein n=1 Tax=Schlesneria paludicola TaxID=360056 RepID=A0A7C2PAD8_9PLAN
MAIKKLSELDPNRPQPAPLEYVGQWVAWNREMNRIVAHGDDVAEVQAQAREAGFPDAILEKVRRPSLYVGAL